MSEEIMLREFQMEDCKALEDIIRDTWHYDEFSSPKAAARLARAYLSSCLTEQTFTRVAVADGVPVGIIMGKNVRTHKCPLKFRLRMLTSTAALLFSKEGRVAAKTFSGVNDTDKRLLTDSRKDYPGEVSFFAINADYRGRGLGKRLFRSLLTYMKEENIPEFYLFTDTSCNYPFYEHQGMKRRCQEKRSFEIQGQKRDMEFFLYEYAG